jgi:hypothetical protein
VEVYSERQGWSIRQQGGGPSYAVVVFLEIQYKYIYTRTYNHSYVIKFSPDLLSVLNSAVRRLG